MGHIYIVKPADVPASSSLSLLLNTMLTKILTTIIQLAIVLCDSELIYISLTGISLDDLVQIDGSSVVLAPSDQWYFYKAFGGTLDGSSGQYQVTTGQYFVVSSDGVLGVGDSGSAPFSIIEGELRYQGEEFIACPIPNGNSYSLLASSVSSGCDQDGWFTPDLSLFDLNGNVIYTYPRDSDEETTTAADTSSTSSTTSSESSTTVAPTTESTTSATTEESSTSATADTTSTSTTAPTTPTTTSSSSSSQETTTSSVSTLIDDQTTSSSSASTSSSSTSPASTLVADQSTSSTGSTSSSSSTGSVSTTDISTTGVTTGTTSASSAFNSSIISITSLLSNFSPKRKIPFWALLFLEFILL